MQKDLLCIEQICKSFGPTKANRNVDLTVSKGEIRGLAGENGSGKSTLASIICGIQRPDSGQMFVNGEKYAPSSPQEAAKYNVSMVVQELGVIPMLTGAVNMFLGKMEPFTKAGIVNLREVEHRAQEVLNHWELGKVPLNCPMGEMSIEQRKIIELGRALATDPDILVLDEITQALSHDTKQIIYTLKNRFQKEGRSMVIITHDLEEALEICETVTVLRDGEVVDTVESKKLTLDMLKQMMIGREISGGYYREDNSPDYEQDVVLNVENFTLKGGQVSDISFKLHKSEILAVCGLSDAGIHSLGSGLFGIDKRASGSVKVVQTGSVLNRPQDAIKNGGAYLSKNRDEEGLMLYATIQDNLFIPSAKECSGKFGFLSPKKINELATKTYEEFNVKATGLNQVISHLSGGNKQKINLGRWLTKDLKFIILDCPTRGVDAGVKAYIYQVILEAKEEGLAILLITDELTEALGMADRILVMKESCEATILERGSDFNEHTIIEVML